MNDKLEKRSSIDIIYRHFYLPEYFNLFYYGLRTPVDLCNHLRFGSRAVKMTVIREQDFRDDLRSLCNTKHFI